MDASLLALIPAFPLLGAIVNAVIGARVPRAVSGGIATAAIAASAVLSFMALADVVGSHGETALTYTLYTWIEAGNFTADIGFLVDAVSSVYICVITGIGTLIHLYSIGYMSDDSDKGSVWRYFSYLNLFVFSMLLLVMGDNAILMFVGWEGVGLCSYLLIGFWFGDTENAIAGKKAFVTNRVGDFCFLIGLFWLAWSLGEATTFNFVELQRVVEANPALVGGAGGLTVTGICMLFFGGATGKSAQIPLYVWLPDAMAGPTPVSALIHAATMVTAGIYMVVRLNFLYVLAPAALGLIAIIGALTAFVAATIAMTQWDIKKVLAYSTVSQLGYMFLGVGVGAFTAGVFHVVTHAFFKALLFLGAGSIIHALHHEQDMRNMGGLRKYMPITFWTFTAAYIAILGFPGTSGFFSKDEILWLAFSANPDNIAIFGDYSFMLPPLLWGLGFVTALMTAFYMSRLYFMTFFGEYRGGGHGDDHGHGDGHDDHGHGHHGDPHESPLVITIPLIILAVLSLFGGFMNLPHWWSHALHLPGPEAALHHYFAESVLHFAEATLVFTPGTTADEFKVMGVTLTAIAGAVWLAWKTYRGYDGGADPLEAIGDLYRGSLEKWRIDEIYEMVLIRPLEDISRDVLGPVIDQLGIDGLVNGAAKGATTLARTYGRLLQNGAIPVYAIVLTSGTVLIVILSAVG